jgi:transposase
VATLNPTRLVFVDESGTHTAMTRLRARAPRGERARGRVPRNHGPNVTLFAALTPQGMGPALVVEGGADHAACATYIRQLLVPSLEPGQVVIMDQLNVHKGATIRALIESAGCELLLLPAYSPDFNPIEQAFAKIKTHLRAAEARTFTALVLAIGTALDTVTPADARGCYAHCGYPLSAQLI